MVVAAPDLARRAHEARRAGAVDEAVGIVVDAVRAGIARASVGLARLDWRRARRSEHAVFVEAVCGAVTVVVGAFIAERRMFASSFAGSRVYRAFDDTRTVLRFRYALELRPR